MCEIFQRLHNMIAYEKKFTVRILVFQHDFIYMFLNILFEIMQMLNEISNQFKMQQTIVQ